ncbi:MAG: hypothetical protein U9O50_03125 [Acidobacteriota bacterium]|nr:hypothetical protein [Acidobacteriota bacterium]
METSRLDKIIENGIKVLLEIFPDEKYLYFPLLYSAIIWAIKRPNEWKKQVFSWQVWANPDRLQTKPDAFILEFFKNDSSLAREYEHEIRGNDLKTLREAFLRLYPLVGLEDPFLSGLFFEELESKDFRKIVKTFDERVRKAKKDVSAPENQTYFIESLKTLDEEVLSLSTQMISQSKVRKAIARILKKQIKGTHE